MASPDSRINAAVTAVARAVRDGSDSSALAKLRRDLAAAKIEAYIEKTVAESPPLTDDQLARIALILGGERHV